jgi:tRNA wybutosine-synthesizing protein 4
MSEVYSKRLEQQERQRIEKLEIFDEFEEWQLLQNHYCLCLGRRPQDPNKDALITI